MIAIRVCRECGVTFDADVGSSTAYCESCQELIAKEDARKIRQVQRQEGMGEAPLDILRLEANMDTIRFSEDRNIGKKKSGNPAMPVRPSEKPKRKKMHAPISLPKSGIILSNEMHKEKES